MILEKIENLNDALILCDMRDTKPAICVNFVRAKYSAPVCYKARLKSQSVVLIVDPLLYVSIVSMGLVLLFIIILFHAS